MSCRLGYGRKSGRPVTLHQLYTTLLIGGVILLASIAAARAAGRLGLPRLLLFLGVDILAGEDVIGLPCDDAALAQSLGTAAPTVILVDGGLTTAWGDIRRLLAPTRCGDTGIRARKK